VIGHVAGTEDSERRKVNMSKGSNKNKDADLAKQFIAGIGKHLANAQSITFGSATLTPADLTQRLQTLVNLRTSVNAAKATAQANLVAEQAQSPALTSQLTGFKAYVKASFSKSPDVLADFGLTPNKARTPLTVEAKAAAAAKRAATRTARHTMGKVQKLDVTGDVVGVTVTPVTAPKPVASAPVASAPSGTVSAGSSPHGS
jgi:hypothetical protein